MGRPDTGGGYDLGHCSGKGGCAVSWELIRLSLGAFLTSPGAGLLGLIGGAWLTYKGVDKRIDADRAMAATAREADLQRELDADARDRWQRAYDHLWVHRSDLPLTAL